MSYSEFSLAELQSRFAIALTENQSLYQDISSAALSDMFAQLLAYYVPLATAIDTEKARSEFIIAPLLAEVRRMLREQISIFSGIDFPVDASMGLKGICDFLVSRSPEQLYIKAPIITVVEAKNDRITQGIPQCIAEMIAVNLYNMQQNNTVSPIYGVVTTGSIWKFLSLQADTVAIDRDEYHISSAPKIVGIFLHMIGNDNA